MIQMVVNGLVTGIIVALPAVAASLTFSVLKFTNFAIGSMITCGAYMALTLNVFLGLPLVVSAALAAVGLGVVAAIADRLVFTPLRARSAVTLLVASMGLAFILENLVRLAFGNTVRSYAIEPARPFRIGDIRLNHEQVIAVSVCLTAMVVLQLVMTRSRLGRALRAVADNPSLAAVRGIDRDRVVRASWMIAGALTAIAGVLIGLDRAIDPLIGWNYLIPVFAAAILGGLGSPAGAVVGALAIGVVEELSTLILPPSYRLGVSFVVIAMMLVVRPNGLFGQLQVRK